MNDSSQCLNSRCYSAKQRFAAKHESASLKASMRYHPQDLDIVAWCDFPHPPISHVPVHFMGLDVKQHLLDCLARIQAEQARRGHRAAGNAPQSLAAEVAGPS